MSSRHFRRIELESNNGNVIHEETDSSGSSDELGKKVFNNFAILSLGEQDDDASSDEQGNKSDGQSSENNQKKNAEGQTIAISESSDDKGSALEPESESEYLDMLLQQKKGKESNVNDDHFQIPTKLSPLLKINQKYLDPTTEMKQKIGNISAADQSEESVLPLQIQAILKQKRAKFRNSSAKKNKNAIIRDRDEWPLVNSNSIELSLEEYVDDVYGEKSFRFVASDSYRAQFRELVNLVHLGDIELIIEFIGRYPMMIDALILVSDYLLMSSATNSLSLLERSIFLLEKCCCRLINITTSPPPMPYSQPSNRKFHLSLFRYAHALSRKGNYQTALQICKIMLSLDKFVDPLCIALLVDFLAFKAGEWEWMSDASEWILNERPWLATWHFSMALMAFERQDPNAQQTLIDAIVDYSWMLPPLARHCKIASFDEDSFKNTFFYESQSKQCQTLQSALSKIHLARFGTIWKSPKNTSFLNEALKASIRMSDEKKEALEYSVSTEELVPLLRYCILSDINVKLLPELSAIPINMYDPIPPESLQTPFSQNCRIL